eukprot:c5358_g1_i1.p2 GENE.c5358_g1_i1~~c5358_g1_i1.p2  ORF type:complete len:530 (-),score=125.80 c5358_g1_i1:63-1625(-)
MAATSSPLKRKRDEEDGTSSVRRKSRAFYMEDVYGDLVGEVPFAVEVRTKIVCTIGPKNSSKEMLKNLLECGCSVARFNFSHGSYEWFTEVITTTRAAAKELGKHVSIMLDTKGPEIRTCKLVGGLPVVLKRGSPFLLHTDTSKPGDATGVAITYPTLNATVIPGDVILVDDGLISLIVREIVGDRVHCEVGNEGELGENKGVNLPGKDVDLPAVTEKDKADIAFGVRMDVDMIAASFMRNAATVEAVRSLPGVREAGIRIISKIESRQGISNFDEILDVSDGIMVARGDLGVEIPIEHVCNEQKRMIWKCNVVGKPVITATQMLDSMIRNPRPTRAEATDVANAVFDGTDAVMLSGETASGRYPCEAVQVMARICVESERMLKHRETYLKIREANPHISPVESIASSAVKTARDLAAKLIIVLTESGNTARLVAKYKPSAVVLALTDLAKTAAALMLTRSVIPVLLKRRIDANDEVVRAGMYEAISYGIIDSGDVIVVVSGTIAGQSGNTNTVRVMTCP